MRLHGSGGDLCHTDAARPARARDADATRADLLQAAKRLFTIYGFDRTTTREIAADAGVNVSLINRYFGSKDGLCAAVLAESADSLAHFEPGTGLSDLVDKLVDGLRADAWPEFGNEHPLLLLLRDVGVDERTAELRRRTLTDVITHLARAAGPPNEARLRAATVLALFAGIVTLRAALSEDPFSPTDPADLHRVLTDATRAILNPR